MNQDKVVLKHQFKASPELIFKAWTKPELMQRWLDGSCDGVDEVRVSQVMSDLRIGGHFEYTMRGELRHHGEYQEIDPPHRLVFTWHSPFVQNTLVTVELKGLGGNTELTLTHERLPAEMLPSHRTGWNRIFRHLDAIINSGGEL